jgi:hypothetical protein
MEPLTWIVAFFGVAVVIGLGATFCPSEAEKAQKDESYFEKYYWEK